MLALVLLATAGFVRDPWIQDATSTSFTIAWQPALQGEQLLHYGPDESMAFTAVGEAAGDGFRATVTGLAPSSSWVYQVRASQQPSPIGRALTAPAGAEPFRFLVLGDTRGSESEQIVVLNAAREASADFVLIAGDLAEGTDFSEFWRLWTPLFRKAALFPAPGNHDEVLAYESQTLRPPWYSFRWGNAAFVSISSMHDYEEGSAQYAWVDAELARLASDATIEWLLAYHHYPVYSSGWQGTFESVVASLDVLYRRHGVDAVFTSHDHQYERIERDGMLYFVTGGGGAPLRPIEALVDGSMLAESVKHYIRVDVDGAIARFTAVRPDGTTIDSRRLSKVVETPTPTPTPMPTPEPPRDAPALVGGPRLGSDETPAPSTGCGAGALSAAIVALGLMAGLRRR